MLNNSTRNHVGGAFNKFTDFFRRAFKIVVDSVCYCYTSYEMIDQFFIIIGSKEQLHQQVEYTLLKPDCHSWWISKMQSGRKDTLEERHAIKSCFKFGKNATETYGMLLGDLAWIEHQFEWHKRFKEGRESMRDDERCGRSKEVNTTELFGQRVRVRVTMSRF